ncbi:MAG: UDP-N-acetylmuramoyl-tripeptide--D-alanyl-D-alanine ligase [Candidatus Berkelbacteria bacterium Athens1014_28]|uniref:UDP-N-acetylmuramoyl-tripeptide--D-alanyl-D-alanine ligase n=1 Tax=Candidatus Berkelbacteria bacterium Athens1014_28 TaxID=2017145 RepID=A0A554LPP6_9BACT|nr:MAG: UDP-N-acetylmuramoyl-tripeptide--D-alanyl-D-alanine ligase [Candidatus Berkelbacteria bacterium Athens1014_28]
MKVKSKSKKIQILEKILRFLARAVINKYNPKIIGITGSVGKSSAKEAIALVLTSKFRVRKSEKNYNNEIGIPLTILGSESGESSFLGWSRVFAKGIFLLIFPWEYPEILVLEMAVDQPGDMDYLLSFVSPDVGVITNISASHMEFFGSVENIAKEKGKLIKGIRNGGMAIINGDDSEIVKIKRDAPVKYIEFGFQDKLKVQATDANFNYIDGKISGISFKLNYQGKIVPFRLPHILAFHQIYSILAAVSIGMQFKINLVDMAQSLENYFPPCGRMNLISGKNGSNIIDDTYNSSPASAIAALKTVAGTSASRRIAVLGDMLELGSESESGHSRVAAEVFSSGVDLFFAVGKRMETAVSDYLKSEKKIEGDEKKVFYFDNPSVTAIELEKIIKNDDLILVKGSQSMRMEKVVENIMEKQFDARELLCRQSKEWRKKPFIEP